MIKDPFPPLPLVPVSQAAVSMAIARIPEDTMFCTHKDAGLLFFMENSSKIKITLYT
jgi:hypothetical protein